METYEQKNRRIFGELLIPEYLEESNKLMNIKLTAKDCLSVVESDSFLTEYFLSGKPFFQTIIPFEERISLREILNQYILDWNIPYLLYSNYSRDCGLLKIPSLNSLNLNFEFHEGDMGTFSLIRKDGKEQINFDFYRRNNKSMLEFNYYRI